MGGAGARKRAESKQEGACSRDQAGTKTVVKRRSVLFFTKANSPCNCRQWWKRRLHPKGTFHVQLQQLLKRKPTNSLSGLKTLIAFIRLTCSTRPCSPLTC